MCADCTHLLLFENTSNTLNVVLPPPSGEMSRRPARLRDVLRSRTEALVSSPEGGADDYDLFQDDFDFSDSGLRDSIIVGDPGGHDFP